ncbi:uncharacterized protein ASPGLDRAFT_26510 [Aspergillus glaucus CBS 516.65]|uniref:Uncharacterized protein n=1 Tax=Aspergillus glaucus CBS 516.65 TaxID=1160497 RepID=A0A1L9VI81_ASPGL|nr:hypothetical protein ASPGLDRAFT_26510 [Aspergillus glaucus CBS 516.65]OJJ83629.1 hypothetical protein ASPGLDRAFT_26510 [Aspergillus glaucus CBS 516.65]
MVVQSSLTFAEKKGLEIYVGTTFTEFGGSYTHSRKEPDLCIKPVGMTLPTVVIESGWSESREQLYEDRDLWLKGGRESVQMVIIVKWTQNAAKQVEGDIELVDLDTDGNARLLQRRSIFPPPGLSEAADSRELTITNGQLWGPLLAGTSDASESLKLSIDELRMIVARNMQVHGCCPVI